MENKKIKRKIRIKWKPLCFVFILAVGLYFLYQFLIVLPITNIYIKGNMLLKDQEIIELAALEDYPSFLKTTSWSIKQKLLESPYFEKVHVKRRLWGQVFIRVEEAKVLFINTENKLVFSNGKESPNTKNILTATLMNYTPDTKYQGLIRQLGKMKDDIREKISEIKYEPTEQDKDRFALYMNDGNMVYLTLTKFNKISYYNTIITDFPCERGILNLDSGNHFEVRENICVSENN